MTYLFDDVSKYMINAAQSYIPGPDDNTNHITPDNKLSEGIDSVQRHLPAPWLPLIRFDKELRTHIVISSQKPVAFANMPDGTSFLVPAGYALALETNDQTIKYTKEDVKNGIKNAEGNPVTDGEAVVTSLQAAGVKISPFCGIVNYNVFRHMGGDGVNPTFYNYRNHNPQPNVSYNMDYAYEYPMVKDYDEYAKAPLDGIAAFIGEKAMAGQFITYDVNSNFVLTSEDDFEYGTIKPQFVIGQVSKVTKFFDPATGDATSNTYNRLNHVINPGHLPDTTGLNNLPGYNNKGIITKVSYANGYGTIAFGLQTR